MIETFNLPELEIPVVPKGTLVSIAKTKENHDDIEIVCEYELIKSVVTHAKQIIDSDEYTKTPIRVSPYRQIQRDSNCTDVSTVQLAICEATNTKGFGRFNGDHASVIMPSATNNFWHLEGELINDIFNSSRANPITTSPEKIAATIEGLESLKTNNFAYVYRQADTKKWQIHSSKSDDVYGAREEIDSEILECFILMNIPTAYRTFNAIDLLETIIKDFRSSRDTAEYLEFAKSLVGHLVPRIK